MRSIPQVLILAAYFVCGAIIVSADDSFLQKPFKSYLFESQTYPEEIQELSRIIGKPVIAPDGVTDFINEMNRWTFGNRVPVLMRIGRGNKTPNMREVLDETAAAMGMKWNYDPSTDRVVMDFGWRRSDPRSGAELLRILESTTSITSQQQRKYFWDNHALSSDAAWQIDFDALLSKADKSSNVWKVRLADDLKRSIIPLPVINLLSAKIKDQSGNEHVIILNDQPISMSPGEGSFSYYVFNLRGKFEQGGIFPSGWRCHAASAWIEPGESRLTFRVFFNESGKMDQHFTLTSKGLVFNNMLDYQIGSILVASDEMLSAGLHMGISPFHVTE